MTSIKQAILDCSQKVSLEDSYVEGFQFLDDGFELTVDFLLSADAQTNSPSAWSKGKMVFRNVESISIAINGCATKDVDGRFDVGGPSFDFIDGVLRINLSIGSIELKARTGGISLLLDDGA